MRRPTFSLFAISTAALLAPLVSHATDTSKADVKTNFTLTLKNHVYTPATITIPANTKVVLHVKNLDDTAEEFESEKLNREKVIPAGQELALPVGPLEAGSYPFIGDYHEDTAHGEIIVK